jgi:hypothetical protein
MYIYFYYVRHILYIAVIERPKIQVISIYDYFKNFHSLIFFISFRLFLDMMGYSFMNVGLGVHAGDRAVKNRTILSVLCVISSPYNMQSNEFKLIHSF